MKTFSRKSMPDKIKYNGEIYTLNPTISAGMKKSNTRPEKVIDAVRSTGKKAVLVEVLSQELKGKTDLHGNTYKPSKWIFTTN